MTSVAGTGTLTVSFDVHGLGLHVLTDHRDIVDAVTRRLLPWRCEAKAEPDLVWSIGAGSLAEIGDARGRPVYDSLHGPVLYDDSLDLLSINAPGAAVRCYPKAGRVYTTLGDHSPETIALAAHPLLTLPLLEMLKHRGRFSLHAGGVTVDDSAVLLAGPSGSGKTTLTIALIREGMGFLTDDMVFLRESTVREGGLDVLGLPDELDVTDETAALLPELSSLVGSQPEPGRFKHQARADEVFGAVVMRDAPLGAVFFPSLSEGPRSWLEPITPTEALIELAPNILLTDPVFAQLHLDMLSQVGRCATLHRLHLGRDLDAAARLVQEHVV